MPKIFNTGNHNIKSPNTCSDLSPLTADLREKTSGGGCKIPEIDPCEFKGKKQNYGSQANCDPLQSGSIINDLTSTPNRQIINRYSNSLRGCDQGVMELFKNIVVLDNDGKAWPVPLIWGSQEKAVMQIVQNNVRKGNIPIVDRPMLPAMALAEGDISVDKNRYIYHKAKLLFRDISGKPTTYGSEIFEKDTVFGVSPGIPIDKSYTLYVWTKYVEDMHQIIEQIIPKFSLMAYIQVRNIPWEIGVSLDSISNNIDMEPGDKNIRTVKYQFNLTAQTYIAQPIIRNKTVLKMKTDFYNSVETDEISQVYDRQEIGTNE